MQSIKIYLTKTDTEQLCVELLEALSTITASNIQNIIVSAPCNFLTDCCKENKYLIIKVLQKLTSYKCNFTIVVTDERGD